MRYIIFIFVFSSFILHSDGRGYRNELKKNINANLLEEKYSESIKYLEEYTSKYPEDLIFHIYLAKSYLYRDDLKLHEKISGIEDIRMIRENYQKASKIFSIKIPELEQKTPGDKKLSDFYFYWALAEMFSGNEDRSLGLFKKCISLNPSNKEAYYNAGIIQQKNSNYKDSDKYLKKYISNP